MYVWRFGSICLGLLLPTSCMKSLWTEDVASSLWRCVCWCRPSGKFENGIVEGEVDASFGPLEALRLSVLTDSPVWVILSEVRHNTSVHHLFLTQMDLHLADNPTYLFVCLCVCVGVCVRVCVCVYMHTHTHTHTHTYIYTYIHTICTLPSSYQYRYPAYFPHWDLMFSKCFFNFFCSVFTYINIYINIFLLILPDNFMLKREKYFPKTK